MDRIFTQSIIVTKDKTASEYGSGLLPVLATPALIALMENTAMQLIELPEGHSSVGISINMKHLKASAIGAKVFCTAKLNQSDGRKYSFSITAFDETGNLIGEAEHERFVVETIRFMKKVIG